MNGPQFNIFTFGLFLVVYFTFLQCFDSARRYTLIATLTILVNVAFAWWLPTYVMNAAFMIAALGAELKEIISQKD